MRKQIIALVGAAIASELIAILIVLVSFGHIISAESGLSKNENMMPLTSSANINDNSSNTKDKNIYDIQADIIFSGNTVFDNYTNKKAILKETVKLDFKQIKDSTIILYVPSVNAAKTIIKKLNIIYIKNNKQYNLPINNWNFENMILKLYLSQKDISLINASSSFTNTNNTNNNNTNFFYLCIDYEIILNERSSTIFYDDNEIYLTNFLITPAIFKDDAQLTVYKTDFGDPYIYNTNNYRITFRTNENIEIYAPGIKEEMFLKNINNASINRITLLEKKSSTRLLSQQPSAIENVSKITIFTALNLRDFPTVIINNNNLSSTIAKNNIHMEKINDTEIWFINSEMTSKHVKDAFLLASEKIGEYPFKQLFVVRAQIPLKGMEFSNMIFISDICFNKNLYNEDSFAGVVYHEVFHQWFYGIIGTDQLNEPFMDEGIVNYLSMKLKGDKLGNNFNNKFFKMVLRDYKTKEQYYDLVYKDAAIYFANIHRKLGDDFYKLLNIIYNEKKFSILYYDEFLQYLSRFTN